MSLDTKNLVLNSSTTIFVILVWPFSLLTLIPINMLSSKLKSTSLYFIKERLMKALLIGFFIRNLLEESLDFFINSLLVFEKQDVSTNGELLSTALSLIITITLILSIAIVPYALSRNKETLRTGK